MHRRIADTTLKAAVAGQQAGNDLRRLLHDSAAERAAQLQADSERGAQAAEYAMLGGVSAAACGGLVAILSRTDILERLVSTVVGTLVDVVQGWF